MSALPRSVCWLASVLLVLLAWRMPVRAQGCHTLVPSGQATPALQTFRVSFGLLAASYGHADVQHGNYQGMYLGAGYRQRWFGLELLLPGYRLSNETGARVGLGDLTVGPSTTFLRALDDQLAFGLALPVMVPTGDAQKSLGMGHVMLMPALFLELTRGLFSLRAEAGYGRAIASEQGASHGEHQHAGSSPARQAPLVNPMNRSEFEHALNAALAVHQYVRVHGRWFGALPVATEGGRARQVLGAGATLHFEPIEITTELQVPVYGDPFDVKLLMQLSALF